MFAYCDNNPTVRIDTGGYFWSLIVGAIVEVASVYISDVIDNIDAGKSGWDIFVPTSSVGTYLGAAVSGAIPGSKLRSSIARVASNVAIKNTTDYICGEKITISSVKQDVFFSAVGEASKCRIEKGINKIRPKKYSTFKNKVTKVFPRINWTQTTNLMYKTNKILYNLEKGGLFSSSLLINRWSKKYE